MASLATALRTLAARAAPRTATASSRTGTRTFGTSHGCSALRGAARRPLNNAFFSASARPTPRPRPFPRAHSRPFSSSGARRAGDAGPGKGTGKPSLGQRMRTLSREYGWSALGVYLALSAVDFPLCYLLVRTVGTERIGAWEAAVVGAVGPVVPAGVKGAWARGRAGVRGTGEGGEAVEMAGWGVGEAGEAERRETEGGRREASLATQLALAYAIHKSFIFIRVPITAAITPRVVKVLRGWGWDIGKKTTKAAKAAKRAEQGK